MKSASLFPRMAGPDIYDPAEGSSQSAYREITGELPSTGEPVTLQNWVSVFRHEFSASAHYQLMWDLLGQVNGDGQAIIRIADIPADWLGNMSERSDLIGERATMWLTSVRDGGDARGGILVALNGEAIHVVGVAPYIAAMGDRAIYVLERVSQSMAARQSSLRLQPANDTMSRLTMLSDVEESLDNASIGESVYRGHSG